MKYKLLGKSGLKVSELCLGTMGFGEDWKWGANYETSKKIFEKFADAGGNFIDTANIYTNGTSEKFLGDACYFYPRITRAIGDGNRAFQCVNHVGNTDFFWTTAQLVPTIDATVRFDKVALGKQLQNLAHGRQW